MKITDKKKDMAIKPMRKDKDKAQGKLEMQKKKKPKRDVTRRLTEAERLSIVAIHNSNMSMRDTAQAAGCSISTVSEVIRKYRNSNPELVEQVKKGLASKLYDIADQSLDKITPERLENVNAYQNAIITATLIDKARLIEGADKVGGNNPLYLHISIASDAFDKSKIIDIIKE